MAANNGTESRGFLEAFDWTAYKTITDPELLQAIGEAFILSIYTINRPDAMTNDSYEHMGKVLINRLNGIFDSALTPKNMREINAAVLNDQEVQLGATATCTSILVESIASPQSTYLPGRQPINVTAVRGTANAALAPHDLGLVDDGTVNHAIMHQANEHLPLAADPGHLRKLKITFCLEMLCTAIDKLTTSNYLEKFEPLIQQCDRLQLQEFGAQLLQLHINVQKSILTYVQSMPAATSAAAADAHHTFSGLQGGFFNNPVAKPKTPVPGDYKQAFLDAGSKK